MRPRTARGVEAEHCRGSHFDGAAGRAAHGVYEGSYWQLLQDCDELHAALAELAVAPPLARVPPLRVPAQPEAPAWADFAPSLKPVPERAAVPELLLPPLQLPLAQVRAAPRASSRTALQLSPPRKARSACVAQSVLIACTRLALQAEPTFVAPLATAVPAVPKTAGEAPVPTFEPPPPPELPQPALPALHLPPPPPPPPQPAAPPEGPPEWGVDWSGTHPRQEPLPEHGAPQLEAEPRPTLPQPPAEPVSLVRHRVASSLQAFAAFRGAALWPMHSGSAVVPGDAGVAAALGANCLHRGRARAPPFACE